MPLFTPNLGTPPDVIARLIDLLDEWGVRSFIDAGCGYGDVLVAAASADPMRSCLGIEVDSHIAEGAKSRIRTLGLSNAEVICEDVRQYERLASVDCVYSYLGGAVHQSLGMIMAGADSGSRLVTALYPVLGLPQVGHDSSQSIPLYWYFPSRAHSHVTWDSAVSISIAHEGGAQLTCRVATVYRDGSLSVQLVTRPDVAKWVSVDLGIIEAFSGQHVVCDIVVRPPAGQSPHPPELVEIFLKSGDVPLSPSHILLVGANPQRAIDSWSPWVSIDEGEAIALAMSDPGRLVLFLLQHEEFGTVI